MKMKIKIDKMKQVHRTILTLQIHTVHTSTQLRQNQTTVDKCAAQTTRILMKTGKKKKGKNGGTAQKFRPREHAYTRSTKEINH